MTLRISTACDIPTFVSNQGPERNNRAARSIPTQCPSCHGSNTVSLGRIPDARAFAGRRLEQKIPGGELFWCGNCLLRFRYPQLSKQELDHLYRLGATKHWERSIDSRTDWSIAKAFIASNLKNSSSVLDVGCFAGGFLRALDESIKKFGIEIHQDSARIAQRNSITIIGADFQEIDKHVGCFDMVVAFDVIEHTSDPYQFLTQLVAATRAGGWIVVSSGNSECLSWKLMGARYWYCSNAEHLSFVSDQWCRKAAIRLGLELHEMHFFSHDKVRVGSWTRDVVFNLGYMLCPKIFGYLRYRFGNAKGEKGRALDLDDPPPWTTARDHVAFILRKI